MANTMKKQEAMNVLRAEAARMLNEGGAMDSALLVAPNTYALKVDGALVGADNMDCWVTVALTAKNWVETEKQEPYDAVFEAEQYAQECEQKEKDKAEKAAEKEKQKAADIARKEARKAKKDASKKNA